MNRIVLQLGSAIILMGLIACSTSSPTVDRPVEQQEVPREEMEWTPEWFGEDDIEDNNTALIAYTTAVDVDSKGAISKAEAWGIARLKRTVSDRLEEIRSEVAEGEGEGSALNDPGFLIDFRKAANAVKEVVASQKTADREVADHQGIRGFAKVQVEKEELIQAIDTIVASHAEQWEELKNSKAFQEF